MRHIRPYVLLVLATPTSLWAWQDDSPVVDTDADGSLDDAQVLVNILKLDNGYTDVAALDLPDSFVRRVADRALRIMVRRKVRRFEAVSRTADETGPPPTGGDPIVGTARVVRRPDINESELERWRTFPRAVPKLRGFRAPLTDRQRLWLEPLGGRYDTELVKRGATLVAERLARAGLVRTTMQLMRNVPLPWVADGRLDHRLAAAAGCPIDWLEFFTVADSDGTSRSLERVLCDWYAAGAFSNAIDPTVEAADFHFRQSRPGFAVMAEDGTERIGVMRMQLPRTRHVYGQDDGSAPDVLKQLLSHPAIRSQQAESIELQLSIEEKNLPSLLAMASTWAGNGQPLNKLTVFPTQLPVSRWTHDACKTGSTPNAAGRPITLVSRFAAINEHAAKFVPGDSFVFRTLDDTSEIVQSPLLFQGGDLLPVTEPGTGRRLLLMGEGEIYRNRALGLSAEQVREAFRIEFGVDRCVVLPAVSYHLDLEVTVRRRGNALVACVNDSAAAARLIVREGIRAMRRGGLIKPEHQTALLTALDQNRIMPLVGTLWTIIEPKRGEDEAFPAAFGSMFTVRSAESGGQNARRFMLALDVLTAAELTKAQLSDESVPLVMRRYARSLKNRETDRAELIAKLKKLEFIVRRIPSLSDEEASINYINGVHLLNAYLMPTFAGHYAPLDAAARSAFADAFGPEVEIVPIRTGALQARYGGLHCVTAVYPSRTDSR